CHPRNESLTLLISKGVQGTAHIPHLCLLMLYNASVNTHIFLFCYIIFHLIFLFSKVHNVNAFLSKILLTSSILRVHIKSTIPLRTFLLILGACVKMSR